MLPLLSFLLLLVICLPSLANPAYATSPDLTVNTVWLEKASDPGQAVTQVMPGEQFNIVASVKNIGDALGSGYYLDVYYDGDYGRGGPDNIAASEVQVWYVGPLTAQDGSHTTRWIIDPDNQIAELSESNNEKTHTFTIGSSTVTTSVTSSSSTAESNSTTTTLTSTSYSTSVTATQTLTLTPSSGAAGAFVSATGSDYQGTTCQFASLPPSLFSSQACSIVAGTLTGNFTVDSGAAVQAYTVRVLTDASESAVSTFSVVQSYSITFYSDPAAGVVMADGVTKANGATQPDYLNGQRVHLIATPPSGYLFTNWETNGVSVDNSTSQDTYMTVSDNGWLKARFAQITYTITFYSDPNSGTITADGVAKSDSATETYASGSRVNVVANPPSGYVFFSWEMNGVSVDSPSSQDTYMTVLSDGLVEAHFAQPQVTVKSKTIFGTEFSGARVRVDGKYYTTPFSSTLQGIHSFNAPSRVTVNRVTYSFARWEDESGNALSTAASLSYGIQANETLYVVYSPPQYSVTLYASDAKSRKAIASASVYLDGNLVGTTDSRGMLALRGIYHGAHAVEIHKDGYVDYVTTISLSASTTFRAYLNRVS